MEKIYLIFISLIFLLSLAEYSEQISSIDKNISDWINCLPSGKIVGGEPIDVKEAPFILSFEVLEFWSREFEPVCGATILSKNIALTAAHCIFQTPFENIRLRSGASTTEKGEIHHIRKAVYHELYIDDKSPHDIALLFVQEPFIFSDIVQPIKFPTKELKTGTSVMVAGYGRVKEQSAPPPFPALYEKRILKRATIPTIDREICKKIMIAKHKELNIPPEKVFVVTEMMFCGGYPGGKVDTCQGDSGGPLYHEGTLYGVINWGIGCAMPCLPGVYASVYKYLDWINKTIAENSQ